MECILCSSKKMLFQLKNSDICCLLCLETYMRQDPYNTFGCFYRDDHGSPWKQRITHALECCSVYPFSNRFSSYHLGQFTLQQSRCRKNDDIVEMFRDQNITYDFFYKLQNDIYYIFELKTIPTPLQYEYADMYPSNYQSILFGIFYIHTKTLFLYGKEHFPSVNTSGYQLKNIYRNLSKNTHLSASITNASNENSSLCTLLNPQIPLYSLYPRIHPIFILSRFHHFRSLHFTDIDFYKEYFEKIEIQYLILYLFYNGILAPVNIHGIREYIISFIL